MNKLLCLLPTIMILSCHTNNEPVKKKSAAELRAEYLQKAIKTDSYKNAYMNVRRIHDFLDSLKKGSMDSIAVIFVYNNSIANPKAPVKTVAQVIQGMKNDTAYLKSAQLKAASDLALEDSISKK